MGGWIKFYRKIRTNPIFNDLQLYRLWSICLMEASHKEHDQPVGKQVVRLDPGQFVTGRYDLKDMYNNGLKQNERVGESTVWRWLKGLENRGYLTINSNSKFSLISIVKWRDYQGEDEKNEQQDEQQNEQQVNSKWTASGQQVDTNKNGNKGKNGEKDKDISTEIRNFRSRYDPELLKLIDLYFDFIKETRKSKKISESIVLKVYEQFARYSPVRIEYAIKAHTSNPQNGKAKEEYTFGILRNCTEEEAAKRLPQMGNQNGFGNKQGYDFDEMARRLKEQNGR